MTSVVPVDPTKHILDVNRDLSVSIRERKPGPPERIDGFSIGVVNMTGDAPHGGEVHPDGDEILYVIAGRALVTGDTSDPVELGPRDS